MGGAEGSEQNVIDLLKRLCETPGVAGHEEPVRELVKQELGRLADQVTVDNLGNVIACRKASAVPGQGRPLKVMIAAHMDEIGLLVSFIDKDGFLRFIPIGGFDPRMLVAQRVIVHGRKDVNGVILPEANLVLTEDGKKTVPGIKDLFIDVGMSRDEVVKLVRVGDVVSLAQDFRELNDRVVTSRNFDDRVGVYIMIEALRRVKECYVDVYAVGTTQEELGLRGGAVASFAVAPDIGIAIDGSLAYDIPGAKDEDRRCILGGGAGIYVMDQRTISDAKITSLLMELAEQHGIRYQINIGGGTDAAVMQTSRAGARVCTIGPPVRYMHSSVQLCHKDDIEHTIELLKVFLENAHKGDWAS